MITQTDQAQWEALRDHTDRLHDLHDRINNVFPSPDTPAGAAQRIRIAVPTPESVITVGARGSATSEGRAIGPGGIAIFTVENLGVQVMGTTCVDTDGLTVTHSVGAMRLLTQADLGIGSVGPLRLGTRDGNVEVTAGHVDVPDPHFHVIPDADVPSSPPPVNTAASRGVTESLRDTWATVWRSLEGAVKSWSFLRRPSGRPPTVAPHAATVISRVSGAYSAGVSALMAAIGVAEGLAETPESSPSPHAKVLLHGEGGVHLTSPHDVDVFGARSADLHSAIKVTIGGGLKAQLKSPIYTAVYGGALAKLKSDGVAAVSGRHTAVSGNTAEVKGHDIASLTSAQRTVVQSGDETAVTATSKLALGARQVHASAEREVHVSAPASRFVGTDAVSVRCGQDGAEAAMLLMNGAHVWLKADNRSNAIEMSNNEIRLKPGGDTSLVVSRDRLTAGRYFTVRHSETSIRSRRINLG